ncbi:MAG TPA: outer membrane beta-barrel protein [Bryobacteraceae bacterium]|nr:outer membrane beta-barrel protein [Bryobacteraceae bacterium]
MRFYRLLSLLTFGAFACSGQTWEVGVAGGYSFYQDASITSGGSSAQAGFKPGGAGSAEVGQDVWQYFGGELRYTYLFGDARLRSGGQEATLGANAQAVHYDFLVYGTPKGSQIRPYVSAGGGIKYYMGTGGESAAQPLRNFAFLTHTSEVEGLFTAGAGLKAHIDEHWLVRVDFRYYLTRLPDNILTPAPGANGHGWLHNFVPMAGIAWTFGR